MWGFMSAKEMKESFAKSIYSLEAIEVDPFDFYYIDDPFPVHCISKIETELLLLIILYIDIWLE